MTARAALCYEAAPMAAERIAGRRPHVTLLFTDLTGFTVISERMDPEAATDLVNGLFAVVEAAIVACGGVLDRYIGDCVVSVWDLFDAAAAARQACHAACVIRAAVRHFNQVTASPAPLDVHSGIASGPLMAGHVVRCHEYAMVARRRTHSPIEFAGQLCVRASPGRPE
jgi:adenylate cyclase